MTRRQPPPEDIVREARVRVMNLPVIHAAVFFIRYEAAALVSCIYICIAGGLTFSYTVSLAVHATLGTAFFLILSFPLTERFLFAVRTSIADGPPSVPLDSSRIIGITLRTRLVVILLATVSAPLIALSVLLYRRVGIELSYMLFEVSPDNPVMSHLFGLIFSVTGVTVLLTSASPFRSTSLSTTAAGSGRRAPPAGEAHSPSASRWTTSGRPRMTIGRETGPADYFRPFSSLFHTSSHHLIP